MQNTFVSNRVQGLASYSIRLFNPPAELKPLIRLTDLGPSGAVQIFIYSSLSNISIDPSRCSDTISHVEILHILMASILTSQSSFPKPAQLYSSEVWEQKRTIISQLYRDEARSLKDVLAILAQDHDFRPTCVSLIATDLSLLPNNFQSRYA